MTSYTLKIVRLNEETGVYEYTSFLARGPYTELELDEALMELCHLQRETGKTYRLFGTDGSVRGSGMNYPEGK